MENLDIQEIKNLYDGLKNDLDKDFGWYAKAFLNAIKYRIREDAFKNKVLKKVQETFPYNPSLIRGSGDGNSEVMILKVPDKDYRYVHDLISDIIRISDDTEEFYLMVHIVNEENTKLHYQRYLKNV